MKQPRWRIFGMAGTWDEYNDYAYTKQSALSLAYRHLSVGHDAYLEQMSNGKVTELRLKEKAHAS